MEEILLELALSFTCSVGFGVVFQIRPKELVYAGLAGVVTRTVLILTGFLTADRLLYTLLGSLIGNFYAVFMGRRRQMPVTKFFYPAMVPMIPGDLLYQSVAALIRLDEAGLSQYGLELVKALLGIALGSAIAPMILHSRAYLRQVSEARGRRGA